MVDNLVMPPAVSSGELLTTRRRELGRSQRSLADRVCAISGRATVTRHEISRYERETRIPTGASLAPLATALEFPEPMLRQAAWFATQRRRLSLGDPGLLRDLHPGYLIGVNDADPQPMIFFGCP